MLFESLLFLYRNYDVVEQPLDLESHTEKMVIESVDFLRKQAEDKHPFLLFVSWLHAHTALDTQARFKNSSQHGPYGDTVQELDWGVGQVFHFTLSYICLDVNLLPEYPDQNGGLSGRVKNRFTSP